MGVSRWERSMLVLSCCWRRGGSGAEVEVQGDDEIVVEVWEVEVSASVGGEANANLCTC